MTISPIKISFDTDFVIRQATHDELPFVIALFREYAAEIGIDLSFQNFEDELSRLPGAYAPPQGALLLAFSSGREPVGCVAMRPMLGTEDCELKRLYVRPQARGLGVASKLVLALIQTAIQQRYHGIYLDTLPSMHAALKLYRSVGFSETPPYYDTPIAGTVFLYKQLEVFEGRHDATDSLV